MRQEEEEEGTPRWSYYPASLSTRKRAKVPRFSNQQFDLHRTASINSNTKCKAKTKIQANAAHLVIRQEGIVHAVGFVVDSVESQPYGGLRPRTAVQCVAVLKLREQAAHVQNLPMQMSYCVDLDIIQMASPG